MKLGVWVKGRSVPSSKKIIVQVGSSVPEEPHSAPLYVLSSQGVCLAEFPKNSFNSDSTHTSTLT
jgi:hypothetical protein